MPLHPSPTTAQRILRATAAGRASSATATARHVTRGTAARTQSAKQFFLEQAKASGKTLVYASKLQKPTSALYSTTLPKFGGGDSGSATTNADFGDGRREFGIMSPCHTVQAFNASSSPSAAASVTFDFDYDEYDLHMSPSQTTSLDFEDNAACDSVGQDDVMDVREARRAWDAEIRTLEEPESILGGDASSASWYESSSPSGSEVGTDFVEMEEDWEVMHTKVVGSARRADAEDGDVVIDW